VHRYDPAAFPDGLDGDEGTFSMCSFLYVECLARAGRLEQAQLAFEKMLTYANHLGLYSEQIGPSGELLGDFPQAFTHLGLISAAIAPDRALTARRAQTVWRFAPGADGGCTGRRKAGDLGKSRRPCDHRSHASG
jgi:GH15 family glucan-1,4-alpha-glucosidase